MALRDKQGKGMNIISILKFTFNLSIARSIKLTLSQFSFMPRFSHPETNGQGTQETLEHTIWGTYTKFDSVIILVFVRLRIFP